MISHDLSPSLTFARVLVGAERAPPALSLQVDAGLRGASTASACATTPPSPAQHIISLRSQKVPRAAYPLHGHSETMIVVAYFPWLTIAHTRLLQASSLSSLLTAAPPSRAFCSPSPSMRTGARLHSEDARALRGRLLVEGVSLPESTRQVPCRNGHRRGRCDDRRGVRRLPERGRGRVQPPVQRRGRHELCRRAWSRRLRRGERAGQLPGHVPLGPRVPAPHGHGAHERRLRDHLER